MKRQGIITPILDPKGDRAGIRFLWRPQLCRRSVRQNTLLAHRADSAPAKPRKK